jgi:hypothetical protein
MFDRAGIDIRTIEQIVTPTTTVLDAARRVGMLVVYLKIAFRPDLSDAPPDSPTWIKHLPLRAGADVTAPDGTPSRVLIRDTWNTEIIEAQRPLAGDLALYKHRYSGFYETGLHDELRDLKITTLLFVGATTSVCVESTVEMRCSGTTTASSWRTARRAHRSGRRTQQPRSLPHRPRTALRVNHRFKRGHRCPRQPRHTRLHWLTGSEPAAP